MKIKLLSLSLVVILLILGTGCEKKAKHEDAVVALLTAIQANDLNTVKGLVLDGDISGNKDYDSVVKVFPVESFMTEANKKLEYTVDGFKANGADTEFAVRYKKDILVDGMKTSLLLYSKAIAELEKPIAAPEKLVNGGKTIIVTDLAKAELESSTTASTEESTTAPTEASTQASSEVATEVSSEINTDVKETVVAIESETSESTTFNSLVRKDNLKIIFNENMDTKAKTDILLLKATNIEGVWYIKGSSELADFISGGNYSFTKEIQASGVDYKISK